MWVLMMMVMMVYGNLWLCSLSSVDLTQQVLLSFLEELISKLPSVWHNLSKTLKNQNKRAETKSKTSICGDRNDKLTIEKVKVFFKEREIGFRVTYIGVELSDKTRKVVVLEVVGKKITCELRGTPNDEGGVVFAPGNYMVCGGIINQLVSFCEEWRRH